MQFGFEILNYLVLQGRIFMVFLLLCSGSKLGISVFLGCVLFVIKFLVGFLLELNWVFECNGVLELCFWGEGVCL